MQSTNGAPGSRPYAESLAHSGTSSRRGRPASTRTKDARCTNHSNATHVLHLVPPRLCMSPPLLSALNSKVPLQEPSKTLQSLDTRSLFACVCDTLARALRHTEQQVLGRLIAPPIPVQTPCKLTSWPLAGGQPTSSARLVPLLTRPDAVDATRKALTPPRRAYNPQLSEAISRVGSEPEALGLLLSTPPTFKLVASRWQIAITFTFHRPPLSVLLQPGQTPSSRPLPGRDTS